MVLRAFKVIILRERREQKTEDRKEIYFSGGVKRRKNTFSIYTAYDVGKWDATEEVSANLMLFNLKASLSREKDTRGRIFGDCKDCR